jgi:hypothetical protein
LGSDLGGEGVPQPGKCFAVEELGPGRGTDGAAVGLREVEDVRQSEPSQDPAGLPVGRRLGVVGSLRSLSSDLVL